MGGKWSLRRVGDVEIVIDGVARKIHHAKTACNSKNRYAVSDDWERVTCKLCLKTKNTPTAAPLPDGVKLASKGCRCGRCFRCRTR